MSDRTCSVEGCDTSVRARGLCARHYQYARTRGVWKDGIPCKGCGLPVRRETAPASTSSYCSPGCYPQCTVDGCGRRQHSIVMGYCDNHYMRWKQYGDAEQPLTRTSNKGLLCAFPGCGRARRKRDWCNSHYGQLRSDAGLTPIVRAWATELVCVVCGAETGKAPGWRKFCGANCSRLWRTHKGKVPMSVACVACGKDIDLRSEANGGRRRRAETKLCRRCRIDKRKHGMSVEQLAVRDGCECGICGEPVDMTLRAPEVMRPSVDHVKARARGGTNDPSNLQLAHFWCNARKGARTVPLASPRQLRLFLPPGGARTVA